MALSINGLIKNCWSEYMSLHKMSCVLSDAIPILWFGDLVAYSSSPIRIVTVSLNPSNLEFQEKSCDPVSVNLRFSPANSIIGKSKLSSNDIKDYLRAMNNYFNDNPYIKWFQWHESALNCLDATYGGKMNKNKNCYLNTAIHIDVESSIPTNPTWGNLCAHCQNSIRNQHGNSFKDLIDLLEPHVIIIASNESIVNKHFGIGKKGFDASISYNKQTIQKNGKPRTVSYIRTYKKTPISSTLIWTMNYNGTPFGGMKMNDPNKISTLKKIGSYIKMTYGNNTKRLTI